MVVNGNALKLSNFEACQQYLYTLVEGARTPTGEGAQEAGCEISMVRHGKTQNTQQKQKNTHSC